MNITDLRASMQRSYEHYLRDAEHPHVFAKQANLLENRAVELCAANSAVVPHYSMQNVLRPLYGKGEAQLPAIGDHPDFVHLKGTDAEVFAPITTLFMDIEGSTRLSLLHPLSRVRKIKNAFICATVEIVNAFDGHVHRLMGDSVMAYFGGRNVRSENATVDALNCASVLRYFVDRVVIPALKQDGFDDPFGIRIGVDHGKKDDVLWSSYGYPGVEEVTATSFYVDVAAKLQQSAGRNQIMIGESLRGLLDFPHELLSTKTVTIDGGQCTKLYVEPNHSDSSGKPVNYRQHIFDWERFLPFTPIGQKDSQYTSKMEVTAAIVDGSGDGERYHPSSRVLPKEKLLRFNIKLPYVPKLPYKLTCRVENHGEEARRDGGETFGNHQTVIEVKTNEQHHKLTHLEATAYRGMHYLRVEASSLFGLSMNTDFGVFIE